MNSTHTQTEPVNLTELAQLLQRAQNALIESEADNRILAAQREDLLMALRGLVSMYERGYVHGTSERLGAAFLSGIDDARRVIERQEIKP